MEIGNFNIHSSNLVTPQRTESTKAHRVVPIKKGEVCTDIFIKERPIAEDKNAIGLLRFTQAVKKYTQNYVKNIKHTYDHKVIFALIEKELFGKNSIDSITHDSDKMILYLLGFPKSFVSEFHRKHSVHHTESGKPANLRSMICDNIASSPEFKPEKSLSLRKHYERSKELQAVKGFGEILEKFNFGENLDFRKIKLEKAMLTGGVKKSSLFALKTLFFFV